jgi:acetyl-CoA carboxylase carboxyltransferase component
VAVVMGSSAGHGALTAPLMDFVVMVNGAAMFSAGPPLVERAVGEHVTKEELGGVDVHVAISGVAHNRAASDAEALGLVRRYLSYFPSNAWQAPPSVSVGDGERELTAILDLIPADHRRGYDVVPVIELLADPGSVLEVQPEFGRSIVTALARLDGETVAVIANQPAVKAGAIDSPAADKAARFLDVVGAFHFPVIFLADNPGVMAGTAAEQSGILRHAARLFAAQARLRSPKLHVTLRKAFGFGSSLMAMNPFDAQTVTLALPGIRLGAMPADGGGAAAGLDADTQQLLEHAELGGAYSAADNLSYDDVIDPRQLRNALVRALRLSRERRQSEPMAPVEYRGLMP